MITYRYNRKNNTITILNQPKKNIRNGIKVYYYRLLDEREQIDYPIATTDMKKGAVYTWIGDNLKILTINIKKPILFGLLGYKWEIAHER